MARARDLIDLDTVRKSFEEGRPVIIPDIDLAVCDIHGHTFRFAMDRVKDPIQRQHRNGSFYEEPELGLIRAHFPQGGTFVDIGANIGNHSLYVAAFLQPKRIMCFEPNPNAYKLLLANIAMNGFHDLFDISHIGMGLSDKESSDFSIAEPDRNLGGARMVAGDGDIPTITGDAALSGQTPDFLKIDVEGMEMMVLNGLKETIQRCTPTILIEVDQQNYDAFDTWVARENYEIIEEMQRYRVNKNFLVRRIPKA